MCDPWFNTTTIFSINELKEQIAHNLQEVQTKFEVFIQQGSGWTFDKVLALNKSVFKYVNMYGGAEYKAKGSNSLHRVKLPLEIVRKKACLQLNNHKNDSRGDECFLHCILTHLKRKTNNPRVRISDFEKWVDQSSLDISNLSFPVSINQIPSFEKKNNLSINVYCFVKDTLKIVIYQPICALIFCSMKTTSFS